VAVIRAPACIAGCLKNCDAQTISAQFCTQNLLPQVPIHGLLHEGVHQTLHSTSQKDRKGLIYCAILWYDCVFSYFWLNLLHFKNNQKHTESDDHITGIPHPGRRRDSTDRTGARNWSRCRPAELGLVKCLAVFLLKQVAEWSGVSTVAIEGIINTYNHIHIYVYIYIHTCKYCSTTYILYWINYNDLTATSE
jgi:hypothetical protein